MINICFADVINDPLVAGSTEEEMLEQHMDKTMLDLFFERGLDIRKGYEYVPNKMRTASGSVVLGYHVFGDMRTDLAWLASPLCTPIDRLIVNHARDPSLMQHLASMMNCSVNYSSFEDEEETSPNAMEDCEEDWLEVDNLINVMKEYVKMVRGGSMSENGGLKTYSEYLDYKTQA